MTYSSYHHTSGCQPGQSPINAHQRLHSNYDARPSSVLDDHDHLAQRLLPVSCLFVCPEQHDWPFKSLECSQSAHVGVTSENVAMQPPLPGYSPYESEACPPQFGLTHRKTAMFLSVFELFKIGYINTVNFENNFLYNSALNTSVVMG